MAKRKLRRHPAVEIFGGKNKKWFRNATQAGFEFHSILMLMRGGKFGLLPDHEKQLLEELSGKTIEQLTAEYRLYEEEHEDILAERKHKRKERSRKLYGTGHYPTEEDNL